ncbi:MAG: hypothetical protein QG608_3582 [Actinomycetota bacterium]|nr:hypothetical protein [Actinomycetota bacterium]
MHRTRVFLVAALAVGAAGIGTVPAPAHSAPSSQVRHRYVVVAASPAGFGDLRAEAWRRGAEVHDLRGSRTMAVEATASQAAGLKKAVPDAVVVRDRVVRLPDPQTGDRRPVALTRPAALTREVAGTVRGPSSRGAVSRPSGRRPAVQEDPAALLPGLMWNTERIRAGQAGAVGSGSPEVTVAVADTGLDSTHAELQGRIDRVVDFTVGEDPPICKGDFGVGDADLAAEYGAPADGDWNGHGTWIGGNVAAALDGSGISGIAPNVTLVSLKISQWCGSAYDSELLSAIEYAGDQGIDVVNISFGGYLDRGIPDQEQMFQAYTRVLSRARDAGTLVVGSAGNEHVRIGSDGQVLSHGSLTTPGDEVTDLHGLWAVPGGLPGVMTVSATGNVVQGVSRECEASAGAGEEFADTCKPASDRHRARGTGQQDQLAYYSNYGPGIDLAAPGGARKFNVPVWDRGGTQGWPVTTQDGYQAFGAFSITSNWATTIPCYLITGEGFPAGQCYTSLQGTSMAAPHVSAAAALVASARPRLRHRPKALAAALRASARDVTNRTQPLSARDTSPADLWSTECSAGYCHLGGRAVPDREAYGAGVLDVRAAVGSR